MAVVVRFVYLECTLSVSFHNIPKQSKNSGNSLTCKFLSSFLCHPNASSNFRNWNRLLKWTDWLTSCCQSTWIYQSLQPCCVVQTIQFLSHMEESPFTYSGNCIMISCQITATTLQQTGMYCISYCLPDWSKESSNSH